MQVLLLVLIPLSEVSSMTSWPTDELQTTTPTSTPTPTATSGTTLPVLVWSQGSSGSASATTTTTTTSLPLTSTVQPPLGCPKCNRARCPRSGAECGLGLGLVSDPCFCCVQGICGLREGAKCFSDAVANDLLPSARALGACGADMECVLRTDLLPTDSTEALCSCIDPSPVCGSDNRTYSSSCRLAQETDSVWLKYRGPCHSPPWIVSAPETEVAVPLGGSASFNCESKGYPTPRLHWERVVDVGVDVATWLPNDDPSISVQLRGGPEAFMGSSWLQILEASKGHAGSYACIAVNSEGQAHAVSRLKVLFSAENPER